MANAAAIKAVFLKFFMLAYFMAPVQKWIQIPHGLLSRTPSGQSIAT
jgi:hypothetical protein